METKVANHKSKTDYYCEYCDYNTSKLNNLNKHFLTLKHLRKRGSMVSSATNLKKNDDVSNLCISNLATFFDTIEFSTKKNNENHKKNEKIEKNENNKKLFICNICERCYKNRSGLWKHQKKCNLNDEESSIISVMSGSTSSTLSNNSSSYDSDDLKEMVKEMMKCLQKDTEMKNELLNQLKEQNKIIVEQQKSINEMIPKVGNNNNNKFNLNFFLNEQCKDALNMSDFIKGLEIQIKDLMYTKNNGLIEGISNVFVNGLRQLDTTKRPIHCTDIKRETLYIKEHDEWEKDEDNKEKLMSALNYIALKERKAILEWEKNNPNWQKSDKGKEEYIKIVKSVMAEVPTEIVRENKIIKNIVKEVQIVKV